MKKIFYLSLISFLAFFIVSGDPFGILFSNGVNAQDTAPEEYPVIKGDTLWDISNSKFRDSFLWPKLWRANPQIKNPDLIYPGDTILIPSKEVLMQMPSVPKYTARPLIKKGKPSLRIAKEKPKEYIVDKNLYIASGWITHKYSPMGEIKNAPSSKTVFGKGDYVYIESDENVSFGDKFYITRKIKKVKHPKKWKSLGYQIRIAGILEVTGMDGENNDVPKAKIASSFEDVLINDDIMPYTEILPPLMPETAGTHDVKGYIVESYMNDEIVGKDDIIYLDKGHDDGLEVGDTFSALSQTPVERSIGKIQIISLQPTTSVAVIRKSDQDITIGKDMWGKK